MMSEYGMVFFSLSGVFANDSDGGMKLYGSPALPLSAQAGLGQRDGVLVD
jgi:hypothetical protein